MSDMSRALKRIGFKGKQVPVKPLPTRRIVMVKWKIVTTTLLGLTALSKFFALLHPARLLYQTDQFFNVPILYVVMGACLVECSLCVGIWRFHDNTKVAWSVLAFALAILAYRTVAVTSGFTHCPCLGNLTDWWPWMGRNENSLLTTIAVWLLLTSTLQLAQKRN